jgi:hypothetical protein
VKSALLSAEDLVGNSSDENTVELREQMNNLTKLMLSIRLKADKQKVNVEHVPWLNHVVVRT